MAKVDLETTARLFMLRGIQNWGQPQSAKDAAKKDFLEAAGFRPGSAEGEQWLETILSKMNWGEVNSEIRQLHAALLERA